MIGDGHTGIENKVMKEDYVQGFKLSLHFLKESDSRCYFVIHASTNIISGARLTPQDFLKILGFTKSRVHCTLHGDHCYYKYVYETPTEGYDFQYNKFCYDEYEKLVENFRTIYETSQKLYDLIGQHANLFPWAERFTQPKMLDIPDNIPAWLDDLRVQEHRDAEKALKENTDQDVYFKSVEYCLWGKGDELVNSVQIIFETLGLKATKTQKGATVDLIVEVPNTNLIFGIEITGTNDAIKKDSNKLTQALTFEQQKSGEEKTLILANTFNDKPIKERQTENFTPQAVQLMTRNLITGLTTYDLYKIWEACKYKGRDITEIMRSIFEHRGGIYAFA